RFDAAALVDGHVDNDRPRRHALEVVAAHEVGGTRAGNEHRTDQQVCPRQAVEDVVPVAVQRGDVARHGVVEVAEAVEVDVENGHVGAESGRDFRGIGTDHPGAQDDDV